jgi:hypothetical protein
MSEPVDARLTLRVPRGGRKDLREEARERLARVETVERVEAFDVTGVRPGLNDLRVHARSTVACETDAADLDASLAEAVGIEAVELLGGGPER